MKLWKVQKFFGDIVYDLRSRNLLLPAILLIVAIVAAPMLISRSSGSSSEPAASGPSLAQTGNAGAETQSAVVSYSPAGLRSYKRRLNELASKNPFKQQFPAASAASASATTAVSGSTGGGSVEPIPGIGTGPGTTGGGGGTTKVVKKGKTKYYSYQTDVQVGESGGTLAALNNIAQFTFLPSAQVPALVYLGTSTGGSQAIFMVSKDVQSVGGDGLCYPSQDSCQLLALNAGKGADLLYGVDHKTYHLQVMRIKRVTSSKPPG